MEPTHLVKRSQLMQFLQQFELVKKSVIYFCRLNWLICPCLDMVVYVYLAFSSSGSKSNFMNACYGYEDTQYSSSSASSSSSSSVEVVTTSSSTHYKKKAAGRKKFKETRHPVYRGVRQRNGEKWVCEVREPNKKSRLWLGTFPNPEMAAVAHDVAALALRGDNAPLNFPDLAQRLPRPVSSSSQDIQRAALQAAKDFIPATSSPASSSIDLENANRKGQKSSSSTLDISSSSDLFDSKNVENKMIVEIPSSEAARDNHGDAGFVDEEAIFNMPLLLDSMAEGMLLTPLAMRKGFDWSNEEDHHDIDFTLWRD
ncbi:hypothetical protein CDL12_06501 [Handroanthus impetiginosus]|uniref:AP2/ERF domain-containing protein n=1 Tax=Handroanthus impetiginosus TaxID=429701 RepID=A0A2G9HTF6_9LAMI|nr:hypothetical protein CDL12_06501 [Handroanthus impetiginosus]